jgi:hypothetical protein
MRSFARDRDLGLAAAQLEFEQPALCGVTGVDTVHFERAHFSERGDELYRGFAGLGRVTRRHDCGDGRQPHEFTQRELGQFAGLPLGVRN